MLGIFVSNNKSCGDAFVTTLKKSHDIKPILFEPAHQNRWVWGFGLGSGGTRRAAAPAPVVTTPRHFAWRRSATCRHLPSAATASTALQPRLAAADPEPRTAKVLTFTSMVFSEF